MLYGCSKTPPNATSAPADVLSTSLEKEALMAALFPGWKPSSDAAVSKQGPAHLHVDRLLHEGSSAEDPHDLDFDPEPWGVVRLDKLHAVLITEAQAGQLAGAGSYDLVGTYFFTDRDGVWHLSKHNDIATWGISNQASDLKVESWPGHGSVLALITTNGEQGENASHVAMTLLTPDNATRTG